MEMIIYSEHILKCSTFITILIKIYKSLRKLVCGKVYPPQKDLILKYFQSAVSPPPPLLPTYTNLKYQTLNL